MAWLLHPQYERIAICTIRKKSLRHCERSAAIHVRALSTMDRHGLRPRDDDAGLQNKAAIKTILRVIASEARQSMSVPCQPWIATAYGLAMTMLGQR
ncbi:MAG: hypothetical protein ABIW96_05350 [Polaromonas sp.]